MPSWKWRSTLADVAARPHVAATEHPSGPWLPGDMAKFGTLP